MQDGGFECRQHRMTYQVTMRGSDGLVMASDRCELAMPEFGTHEVEVSNRITKIQCSGQFAWAFSGGTIGPVLAKHIRRALIGIAKFTDDDIIELIDGCRQPALDEWQSAATQRSSQLSIVFACGESGSIFRCNAMPVGDIDRVAESPYISGNHRNPASILPRRFFSTDMSVDALARLAAYAIRAAHDIDPHYVDGLDIAIYRNSVGRFELVAPDHFWQQVPEIDAEIRAVLRAGESRPRD